MAARKPVSTYANCVRKLQSDISEIRDGTILLSIRMGALDGLVNEAVLFSREFLESTKSRIVSLRIVGKINKFFVSNPLIARKNWIEFGYGSGVLPSSLQIGQKNR